MAEDIKMERAKEVYDDICTALDNRKWNYDKDPEKLIVHFDVSGEDLPMKFIIIVDADIQLVSLLSPMPFNFSEKNRMDGAIATCVATFGMVDGSFDYDLSNGMVVFRMTATFLESKLGETLLQYMINCSAAMVDRYNDKFFAIDKGLLSIEDFIAAE